MEPITWKFLRNVLIKATVLLVILSLLPVWVRLPDMGKISGYNTIFPGRERLPFGEDSQTAYNLSMYNLNAMFASLRIAGKAKPANEFRVIFIGDSSVWGSLLRPNETLAGVLDGENLVTCDARPIHFYNLGYPTLSLTKDLMILQEAMQYHPDLIVWPVTLESFPINGQFSSPLLANNPEKVKKLSDATGLKLNLNDPELAHPAWWEETLIGQRRAIADLFRLQAYGVLWAATGLDQAYPQDYPRAQRDFKASDMKFHELGPGSLDATQLALDDLSAGVRLAGNTPVVIVNEPILISSGANSNVRYNFYYPRWAYDAYRNIIAESVHKAGWNYVDAWNLVSEDHFTNSAIHMDPGGTHLFAETILSNLRSKMCIR